MDILPPRPLPLSEKNLASRRQKASLQCVFVALIGLAMLAGGVWLGTEAWQERQIWQKGVEGRVLRTKGSVESNSVLFVDLFYEYKLDVTFADAQDRPHDARVTISSLWKEVDTDQPATLRYLPEDPQRPVLSYSIDLGFWRWALPLSVGVLGLLIVAGAVVIPRRQRQMEAALREVALDGEEVLYPVLSVSRYKQTWTVKYEPSPGMKKKVSGTEEPLIAVRDGRQHVVMLRSPRSPTPVMLARDLAAFELDPAQRAALDERLRG